MTGTKPVRVWVAGHQGMVGAALCRQLTAQPGIRLLTASRQQLDLTSQAATLAFVQQQQPDHIYLAAAKVGGILANSQQPADFLLQNLQIVTQVVDAAWRCGVARVMVLGSSCIYPRLAQQPVTEDALLTGALEPTNEAYAIAKIAGLKLCQAFNRQYGTDFRTAMPTNLYGPGDHYAPGASHVIPGLMHRMHLAKVQQQAELQVWGSGRPLREFLHVDDLAVALVQLMQLPQADYQQLLGSGPEHLNIGSDDEVSIADLVQLLAEVIGYQGRLVFDTSKPDGTPRKRLDSSRIHRLGWRPAFSLRQGLAHTYQWYLSQSQLRGVKA